MFGAGVGVSHMTGQVKALLGKITAIDQANYPEMMGKTLIINAPRVFKWVWAAVKGFLDARTLAKIEVSNTAVISHLPYQSVSQSRWHQNTEPWWSVILSRSSANDEQQYETSLCSCMGRATRLHCCNTSTKTTCPSIWGETPKRPCLMMWAHGRTRS